MDCTISGRMGELKTLGSGWVLSVALPSPPVQFVSSWLSQSEDEVDLPMTVLYLPLSVTLLKAKDFNWNLHNGSGSHGCGGSSSTLIAVLLELEVNFVRVGGLRLAGVRTQRNLPSVAQTVHMKSNRHGPWSH
jgi:hypothetical protein